MVLIRPHDGDVSGTAALLLALADQEDNDFGPADVQTDTDDGFQFRVPEGLAEVYEKYLKAGASEAAEEDPKPAKRGPGRPKKTEA